MKITINLILLFGILCPIKCQETRTKIDSLPPTHVSPIPYLLEEKSTIVIPDSVINIKVKGKVGITFFIDENVKVLGFNILYMKLKDESGNSIINYYKYLDGIQPKSIYPKEVFKYYNLIEETTKRLKFKKNESEKIGALNIITYVFDIKNDILTH